MPVYLDCNAAPPTDTRVIRAVSNWMENIEGHELARNHHHGRQAQALVEKAKQQIAELVCVESSGVLFTSGATESNNLAILGLADHGVRTGKRHLVTSAIEHPTVLEPMRYLERQGYELEIVGVDKSGRVDPKAIAAAVRPDTLLVSLMLANNVTGIIQPIEILADHLRETGALFHVDAAQGFSQLWDVLGHPSIDLISMSGPKMHGPPGIGALVMRGRVPLKPLLLGGSYSGLRPGTLPVPLVAGLGLAAELAGLEQSWRLQRNRQFGKRLWRALAPLKPVRIGSASNSLAHTLCVAFPSIDAEMAITGLNNHISISKGAASTSALSGPSPVLEAMGLDAQLQDGAMRFSWCHETPELDLPLLTTSLNLLHKI